VLTELLAAVSVNFSIVYEGCFLPLHQGQQTTRITYMLAKMAKERGERNSYLGTIVHFYLYCDTVMVFNFYCSQLKIV